MHYLMFYDVADDYAEKRMPFRAAHIAYARKAVARGDLVLGGALASPADGAVFVFRSSIAGRRRNVCRRRIPTS